MNLDLLKQILAVPTCSRQEKRMVALPMAYPFAATANDLAAPLFKVTGLQMA